MYENKYIEMYNYMLDEVYGEISVGGSSMCASVNLYRADPTAYRVGFIDWVDSEGFDENDTELAEAYTLLP